MYIEKNSKIFIAGHRGMVGSAILRQFQSAGYSNIVTRTHKELDLTIQKDVYEFLEKEKPDAIIDAAAKVGGILANNTYRADFLHHNIAIQSNLIWGAHLHNVKSFIFLGSSCIYPKACPQPIKEEYLLSGPLEETNRPYALAKIHGIDLIDSLNKQYNRSYVSIMPCNLYGPNDNYDPNNSHVIPGLIRKFFNAEKEKSSELIVWGSGTPLREFLHCDDLASAVLKTASLSLEELKNTFISYPGARSFLNVGSGEEISIQKLAELLKELFSYHGKLTFDSTKPDGTLRKVMDSTQFKRTGWKPSTSLKDGLKDTIAQLRNLKLF